MHGFGVLGGAGDCQLNELAFVFNRLSSVSGHVRVSGHVANLNARDGFSRLLPRLERRCQKRLMKSAFFRYEFGGGYDGVGRAMDVNPDVSRQAVERFFQRRDFRSGEFRVELDAGVQIPDFFKRQVSDGACPVGRSVYGRVVHDNHFAVFGQLDVKLYHLRALFHSGLERRNGVFRIKLFVAAMGANAALRHDNGVVCQNQRKAQKGEGDKEVDGFLHGVV